MPHRTTARRTLLGLLVLALAAAVAMGRPVAPAAARPAALGQVSVPGWISTGHEIDTGGRHRGYLVLRPSDTGESGTGRLPVVVLLHGRGMTPAAMAVRSGLTQHRDALLVVPAGYGRSWNAGDCCGAARTAGVDDVTFVAGVVRQVLARYSAADPRRVYLVGYSNGGRMAYRLACARPALFRAVAAVEAVPVAACASVRRPVPLLVVASSRDPLLRITPAAPPRAIDGVPQTSVEDGVRTWRALDGCTTAKPRATVVGTLTRRTWAACRAGSRLRYDLYAGGSHAWPVGSSTTPGAQTEIRSFFAIG